MELTLYSDSVADNPVLAQNILEACKNRKIFAIFGDLGAGKTTLVKSLCATLGAPDIVKSPTFSIVNEYEGNEGPIYHFDFYRIKNLYEAYDLGYEEYFYSGNVCFVEWPEKIEELIPEEAVEIRIEITGENTRTITISFQEGVQ